MSLFDSVFYKGTLYKQREDGKDLVRSLCKVRHTHTTVGINLKGIFLKKINKKSLSSTKEDGKDHLCEVKYKASIWMQFSRRIGTITGATLALLIQPKDYLALPFDFPIRIIQTVLLNSAGIHKPSAYMKKEIVKICQQTRFP